MKSAGLWDILVRGGACFVCGWLVLIGLMAVFPSSSKDTFITGGGGHPSSDFGGDSGAMGSVLRRIDNALLDIKELKTNNDAMKRLLEGSFASPVVSGANDGVAGPASAMFTKSDSPTGLYEKTRRDLELELREFWFNMRSKANTPEQLDFSTLADIYKDLRFKLENLRKADGYESWRAQETAKLSEIVQGRLKFLQNPEDCSRAKKLVCVLNKGCGFGCQVHHAAYCLVTAYATGRTLILESKGWRYNRAGWDKVFLPVSETCTSSAGDSRGDWSGIRSDVQVVQLPIVDFLKPRPAFLPVAIPAELAPRLEKVHGEPHVWWVGQFMKYILRPQPSTQAMLDEAKASAKISSPTVGLHVRRTDKIGTEASYHALAEYMTHAQEFFDIKDRAGGVSRSGKKRVFIASDDPGVIAEAERTYGSDWEILGDRRVAESAALSQRYNGLNGIIRDVFLLAECDFLVCTFSSQVCRLAYELLQAKHVDASDRFVSLDDIYYYGGGVGLDQKVVTAHKPKAPNELALEVGDTIGIAGNHWNGLSKGTNRRTNKVGLYPSYKARNEYSRVNFPEKKWWPPKLDS